MKEREVIITWEAIYDVTDIADYIEEQFSKERADRFQNEIEEQIRALGKNSAEYVSSQIIYRGYCVYKKTFFPSIIFYIVKEAEKEVHVLRVLRHEQNWESKLKLQKKYTYPDGQSF